MRAIIFLLLVSIFFVPHVGAIKTNQADGSQTNPYPVPLNSSISSTLAPSKAVYYYIEANFTGGLSLNISTSAAVASTTIDVYTSANSIQSYTYQEYIVVFNYYINLGIQKVVINLSGQEATPYDINATAYPEQQEQNYSPQSQSNLTLEQFSPHTYQKSLGKQYFGFHLNHSGMTRMSVLIPDPTLIINLYDSSGVETPFYDYDVYGRGYSLLLNLTAGDYYFAIWAPLTSTTTAFYQTWVSQIHIDILETPYILPISQRPLAYGTISTNDTDTFLWAPPAFLSGSALLFLTAAGGNPNALGGGIMLNNSYVDVYKESDDSSVATANNNATFDVSNASYLFKVKSNSNTPVDYRMSILFVGPDFFETHGNSMNDALSLETDYTGLNIHNSTDRDWFSIIVGDPANVTFTINYFAPTIPILDVYDHNGVPVPGDITNTTDTITYKAHFTPDTYYFKISPLKVNVLFYQVKIHFDFDTTTKTSKKVPGFELPIFLIALFTTEKLRKTHRKSI